MSRISNFISDLSKTFGAEGAENAAVGNAKEQFFTPSFAAPNKAWSANLAVNLKAADETGASRSSDAKKQVLATKSSDAKTIRDSILRDEFQFDKEDIAEYDRSTNGTGFIIFDESAAAKSKTLSWATAKQIAGWRTENGKIAIDIPESKIAELNAFRQERVIDRHVAKIADPNLRQNVKFELSQLMGGDGEKRLSAALQLEGLQSLRQADAQKIREAIKAVAEQPQAKDNPAAQILLAKMTWQDLETTAQPRDIERDLLKLQAQTIAAAQKAGGAQANRQEAAWTNRQAAQILDQIGDGGEARYREMLARFYQADDRERQSAESPLGQYIERWKTTNAPTMIGETTEQRDFRLLKAGIKAPKDTRTLAEDPQKRQYNGDKNTLISTVTKGNLERGGTLKGDMRLEKMHEQTFAVEGSLKLEGDKVNVERHLSNKGVPVSQNVPYDRKELTTAKAPYQGTELNKRGTTRATGASGAVNGLETFNAQFPFWVDALITGKTIKAINKYNKLEQAAIDSTRYAVPPKPEELPKIEQALRAKTKTPAERQQVTLVMQRFEEASNAFWKR